MALGLSGSNGGISDNVKKIDVAELQYDIIRKKYDLPLEVSYFINNKCNLRCKHCYVGYQCNDNSLPVKGWKEVFDSLLTRGALTFGNVGKEPTLSWDKTIELLCYFHDKKKSIPKLRFGMVTNGILLDTPKIKALEKIQPDYVDISIDGTKKVHDHIRGIGAYDKTIEVIRNIAAHELIQKVFISFTVNKTNISSFGEMVDTLYKLGVRNFLVSPYITLDESDELFLPMSQITAWTKKLLAGEIIDFDKYEGLQLYIKNDYTTTRDLMDEFVSYGIIDLDNLLIDDYGVIFTKYCFGRNHIYFNYLPWDDYLTRAIRISHDGYVGNCLDMFYEDYPKRSLGNVRETSIEKLLNDLSRKTILNR